MTQAATASAPASRGRPQDDELTQSILRETARQLITDGYADLRIERVAAAVGCGKSAVYRRWRTRGELVAATISELSTVGTIPDTGSLVDDLVLHASQNERNQRAHPSGPSAFAALVSPDVRDQLWDDGFLARRRDMGRRILLRAIERDRIAAGVDIDAVLDLLAGFVLYRTTVRPVSTDAAALRSVVAALVASPPLTSTPGDRS